MSKYDKGSPGNMEVLCYKYLISWADYFREDCIHAHSNHCKSWTANKYIGEDVQPWINWRDVLAPINCSL